MTEEHFDTFCVNIIMTLVSYSYIYIEITTMICDNMYIVYVCVCVCVRLCVSVRGMFANREGEMASIALEGSGIYIR